jgi:mannose-6-phosphate isomerase
LFIQRGRSVSEAQTNRFFLDSRMMPLRLSSLFKQRPWGGRRLAERWNKPSGDSVGWAESWEVVDLGDEQSQVIGGPFNGRTLHELIRERGAELLGRHAASEQFPLLFKFLDAAEHLSVQVHPNDEIAQRLRPGQRGKTEAWVILDAAPGSELFVGLRLGVDRATFERHLVAGTVVDCLHSFPARIGDVVFVPAGIVHAIGAGVALAEFQQPSDITFRLFDWNRVDADGRSRPLHLSESLQCLDFARGPVSPTPPRLLNERDFDTPKETQQFAPPDTSMGLEHSARRCHEELVACRYFELRRHCSTKTPFAVPTRGCCHVLSLIEGSAAIVSATDKHVLAAGQTIVVPASCGHVVVVPSDSCVLLEAMPV